MTRTMAFEQSLEKKLLEIVLYMKISLPAGRSKSIWSPPSALASTIAVVVVVDVFLLVVVVVVVVGRLKLLDPGGHTLPPVHLLLPHPHPPICPLSLLSHWHSKTQSLSAKTDSSSHRNETEKHGRLRRVTTGCGCARVGRQRRTEPMAPTVCLSRDPSSLPMPNTVVRLSHSHVIATQHLSSRSPARLIN